MSVKTDGEKKKGSVALIVCLLFVVLALVVVIIFLVNKNNHDEDMLNDVSVSDIEKRNIIINEDNIDEVIEQLSEDDRVPPGNYEVVMNTEWNFPDGHSPSTDAYVENAVSNTNDVYFDILLADTNENIFKSPLLPIGSHIEGLTLDKSLSAGSYDCVIVYSLVDEEQTVLSNVQVALTINIEN